MNVDEALSRVVEIEAEIAALQAEQARLVTRIVDDPCEGAPAPMLDKHYLEVELRVALGESARACGYRIHLARTLVRQLPNTLTALAAGKLTFRHASALVHALDQLDHPSPDAVSAFETACLTFAAGHDYPAFTRKIRRELAALPISEEHGRRRVRDRQTVWSNPDPDGLTATVGAVLPAAGARTLMSAVDTAADLPVPDRGDDTLDQRRADALVRIATDWLDALETTSDPTTAAAARRLRRHGPDVQVTVALSTLLGLDDQPGELDGHGPVPAALARQLADDPHGTWRRLVTDDLGHLIDYGRTRYAPPTRLREFVVARDRECRFPGCHRRGRYCEIDHLQAWSDGGSTNERNLVCLCRRHHHLKHDTTWTIQRLPAGTLRWTSPHGRVYLTETAAYPVDRTMQDVDHGDRRSAAVA